MSRRTKIIIGIVALVVVLGAVAFFVFGSQGSGPEVEIATVAERQLAVTVTASGKVEKGVSADVFPPTVGTLDSIAVSNGETVTAGQTIAMMDTAPLELQVAQAQAGLSQAQAQLANIDAQSTSSADIRAARAQVDATYQAYLAAKAQAAAVGDQAPSQAQLDAAEANTKAAKTAYNNAVAAYEAAVAASPNPSQDATVAAAAAGRDSAYAAYLGAKAQQDSLESTDLTAAKKQAQAGVDQAFAAWKGAQAQLSKAQSADPNASRKAAQAAVDQAAEALSAAETNLEKATLTAPIDGVVIFNSSAGAAAAAAGADVGLPTDGAAVSPQAAPFTVVNLEALKFTAEVDEADIERVAVGMKTVVSLDAFPGEEIASTVTRIDPAAQATATGGTVFNVEIALDDTGKEILLGMKGDATIEVSSVGGALTIPVEALFSEGGTDFVYVVVNDNTLKKTEITVGATTDTEVEVLEGLKAGEVVALSGSTQYTDGMTVRVKGN